MPRTHVRKTVGYEKTFLLTALKDIEKGKTIREASIQYGVPSEILRKWVRNPSTPIGRGRVSVFTLEEELCIVNAVKFLHDCDFPCYRPDLVNIARDYMELNGKPGRPEVGFEWARSFERRWSRHLPKFPSSRLQAVHQFREAPLPENVANRFFLTYINRLDENGLSNHPDRIFNLAEAGLSTDIGANEVFISNQSRDQRRISSVASGKAVYSVLFCISAGGSYMPPFTIYESARLNHSWTKCGPPGALYGCSVSGGMDEKIFESWMEHFVSYTKNTEKPIVLIFDGYYSRLTYKIIKTAVDNQVVLCCLPPSHVLQPLDVGVSAPAEKSWR